MGRTPATVPGNPPCVSDPDCSEAWKLPFSQDNSSECSVPGTLLDTSHIFLVTHSIIPTT